MVDGNSPADKAGLRENDIVTRFGDTKIVDEVSLREAISSTKPGAVIPVAVLRAGQPRILTVTIGAVPVERVTGTPAPTTPKVTPRAPSKLGIRPQAVTETVANRASLPSATRGVLVGDLIPGGLAADAGIFPGDIILTANGVAATSADVLDKIVASGKSGEVVSLTVFRPANPSMGMKNPARLALDVTIP